MTDLKTSQTGLKLIKDFESFKAMPYFCQAGKKTIGYGHVILPKEDSDDGLKFNGKLLPITEATALELLARDCATVELPINALNLGLSQSQFDAVVSLTFNIGLQNLKNSTLLKLLLKGSKSAASAQFAVWNKARVLNQKTGQRELTVLPGLVRRRAAEAKLFSTGVYP